MSWIFANPWTVLAIYVAFCLGLYGGLIALSETWPRNEGDH